MSGKDRIYLSIVIPALDEGGNIGAAIEGLKGGAVGCPYEVIVADGGSTDATVEKARAHGALVVVGEPGRGRQLAAGAGRASGKWLLFLHADTGLEAGWYGEAERFMESGTNSFRAAVFGFQLDDHGASARALRVIVDWRTRLLALPYGDQGLLISRAFYEELRGHAPLAIMEDVDIIRRIGRRRLHVFNSRAITSAERYRRDGYIFRPLKNTFCLGLYFLGLPNRLIARLYR